MKITHIRHSTFLVEDEYASYLFDYYKGTMPELNMDKPLYCFASHIHYDHFSKQLFTETAHHPDVHYILSNDIKEKLVPADMKSRTSFMGPDETLVLSEGESQRARISVKTLASTDEGVAFIVSSDEKLIYHAGDLHDWLWEEEGEAYNRQMEANYLKEMKKIEGMHFSLAFLPLDPRQAVEDRPKGIRLFLQHASADNIFPMHMWDKYETAEEYLQTPEGQKCSGFRKVSQQNETFIIS